MTKVTLTFAAAFSLVAAMTLTMMRPSFALQAFTTFSCAVTSGCVFGNNGSTGPGVQGTSKSGRGVVGITNFNSTSTTGQAGVYGIDNSTTGASDTGVTGQSNRGRGVMGRSTIGYGVYGLSTSGFGVTGQATNNIGVLGVGNTAVEGTDNQTTTRLDDIFANGFGANLFRGNNSHGIDVFKVADSGLVTMYEATVGNSSVYTGLYAQGYPVGANGVDLSPYGGEGVRGDSSSSGNSIAVYAHSNGGYLFDGDAGGGSVFYVDRAGNVHAHSFTMDLAAAARTANGTTVATYSHEVRTPTIEDFGEAMLAAGRAYVRLDPSFAGTLQRGVPYFVFITPMGPTRGSLYVSDRTATGFFVHENGGGASTVAFDYRIVGKRFMPPAPANSFLPHPSQIRPPLPDFTMHAKIRPAVPH